MLREGTSRQLHAWLADGLLERRNHLCARARIAARVDPVAIAAAEAGPTYQHRLSARGSVSLQELSGQPMAGYHRGTDIRDTIDLALSRVIAPPAIVLETNDTAALEAAVRARLALAMLLPSEHQNWSGLVLVDTVPQLVWSVGLAFPGRSRWAPVLRGAGRSRTSHYGLNGSTATPYATRTNRVIRPTSTTRANQPSRIVVAPASRATA